MTRHFELFPPSYNSIGGPDRWGRLEYERAENGDLTAIEHCTVWIHDTPALRALVEPLATRDQAQRWLAEQWNAAALAGDETALKALAWVLRLMEESEAK